MEETATDRRVAEQVRASLATVLPSIGAVYGALTVLYLIAPPLHPGWPYAASSGIAAAGQLLLAWRVRRARLGRVHAIGLVAASPMRCRSWGSPATRRRASSS